MLLCPLHSQIGLHVQESQSQDANMTSHVVVQFTGIATLRITLSASFSSHFGHALSGADTSYVVLKKAKSLVNSV